MRLDRRLQASALRRVRKRGGKGNAGHSDGIVYRSPTGALLRFGPQHRCSYAVYVGVARTGNRREDERFDRARRNRDVGAVHFGVRQQLTAKITEMDKPHRFVDEMVKGAFARFYHEHTFMPEAEGTRMTDTFDYTSPCGPLGWLADAWFLERYMRRLLAERNAVVKRLAEEQVVATEKIHSDMKRSSKHPF